MKTLSSILIGILIVILLPHLLAEADAPEPEQEVINEPEIHDRWAEPQIIRERPEV